MPDIRVDGQFQVFDSLQFVFGQILNPGLFEFESVFTKRIQFHRDQVFADRIVEKFADHFVIAENRIGRIVFFLAQVFFVRFQKIYIDVGEFQLLPGVVVKFG